MLVHATRTGGVARAIGAQLGKGVNVSYTHLPEAARKTVASLADGEVIGHDTAKLIAEAYTWGWASCWFAGTGQFHPPTCGGAWDVAPHKAMARSLFYWWADGEDEPISDAERAVFAAMEAYMLRRWEAGDTGEVAGWKDLPAR